jgi:signal peptidase
MDPTIPRGSIVYDELVPVDKLEVGDVITFVPPPEFHINESVTHRIVSIDTAPPNSARAGQRVFKTKGDANAAPDAWEMVLHEDRQPRVAHHLPWIGYVYMALNQRWVQLLVVGLPALVIVVVLLVSLWRLAGESVREERAGATP